MPTNSASRHEDDHLLEQLRQGIEIDKSFHRLFHRYYLLIVHFFREHKIPEDRCHDLAQEVFLNIYDGIKSFRGESSFATWALAIANNVYKKELRKSATGKRSAIEISLETDDDPSRSDGRNLSTKLPGPLRQLLGKESVQQLQKAVDRLPRQMRQCVMLRAYQELSYGEIAQILQVSIDIVKVQLSRARKRLRQELGQHLDEL